MKVQMKDGLPGIGTNISEKAISIFKLQFVCQLLSNREDVCERLTVFPGQLIHGGDMMPWYEQDMVRSLWMDILKGYYMVVLVYNGTRYLSGCDFAK